MKFNLFIKKLHSAKKPLLAILIDPDKFNPELIKIANSCKVSCFLVGGSVLKSGNITKTVNVIKTLSNIPVILFPGDENQLSKYADGLFLPSLISGRNPDYLIEKHITMAPKINVMKLQHLPMAYILIDGGKPSQTQIVTKTMPLNPQNSSYIVNTALAAEHLGFKLLYLEAGSGAKVGIPTSLVRTIKKQVKIPVIVGGGIDSVQKMKKVINSGANIIVVGNALEKDVYLLPKLSMCF
ncbi:MAG: geranylgeranylglyceryl/heptaprenylglyceryl phosphate synthase [Bacteroidota bacterium]|nr:geranylgeranylglyceryl/heptaprenylglyceryl phosphate synthase [Bacteroidota bacterium]